MEFRDVESIVLHEVYCLSSCLFKKLLFNYVLWSIL